MEEVRRQKRGVRQSLASIVLAFELIVVFLASLVAWGLKVQPGPVALVGGGVVCLAILFTLATLRYDWAFVVGSVLQGVIVATGIFVPVMWLIGLVFAGMWVYCMVVGGRIDRQNAATPETES
ncbi:DUF4233 domain-containing protein [Mycetocola miduiensis]|uniref:DUF4233 domain-containing protein n=1 Tax=Mycetocola miduiensis TaxID=995034 RepID=A0A1I4ZUQ0_9MICO|nr:DUF4233 domain-containing protein [Mycetocola miduiensis]SFN53951.1 Protein of unknown function [Mycetocola miduiensis]